MTNLFQGQGGLSITQLLASQNVKDIGVAVKVLQNLMKSEKKSPKSKERTLTPEQSKQANAWIAKWKLYAAFPAVRICASE